ncbi:phage tail protein [uncultured Tateyamaria sp.]|uniref:phage tail-collar fiber domain-containing protein n=1 Tax=uncultured Tateyamaria sp. TaxID=455651 RepID=UPI00260660F6|nr:phage tail protein [uncultured Tateyamaria sp.]
MASFAMLTNVGRNKEAAALANATALDIAEIAWGDGKRIPAGGETALENEQGRKPVAGQGITNGAPNAAFFEVLLAESEGPYIIREAGIFDVDGDLIAVAHYDPPVNKPLNTVSAHLRINVVFTDLENLIIKIDDSTAFVPVQRTLTAGTGLVGGGNLTADRTIALAPEVMNALIRPFKVTLLTEGANATYVTPEYCKALWLKGTAAGAGGETPSRPSSGVRFGHPGGGGAGFEAWLIPEPLQEFTYTIGAGGPGGGFNEGTRGGSGGSTRFGSISANGGTNVVVGSTAWVSHGNDPLMKVLTFRGSPGIQSWAAGSNGKEWPHTPGGSIFGPSDSLARTAGQGQDATVPGTGGQGGINYPGGSHSADYVGLNGAAGLIRVMEFY